MMWFFILIGIAIVVIFVVVGYKLAAKAANEPDDTAARKPQDK